MNYTNLYNNIINNAKQQLRRKGEGVYYEKHHIVPKSMGGNNNPQNLVLLTAKEHFIVHHLLYKIYPDNKGLAVAYNVMQYGNSKLGQTRVKKINPRTVESIKNGLLEYWVGIGKKSGLKAKENGQMYKAMEKAKLHGFTPSNGGRASYAKGVTYNNYLKSINKGFNSVNGNKHLKFKNKTAENHLLLKHGFEENYKINFEEAKDHKINFYYGVVCLEHPQLEGRRRTKDKTCYKCQLKKNKELQLESVVLSKEKSISIDEAKAILIFKNQSQAGVITGQNKVQRAIQALKDKAKELGLEASQITLSLALKHNLKHYYGGICQHCSELNGLRRVGSRCCISRGKHSC